MANKYPIECYGVKFTKGSDFNDWIDDLIDSEEITADQWLIVEYTYDNGYLNHPDYKSLKRKAINQG